MTYKLTEDQRERVEQLLESVISPANGTDAEVIADHLRPLVERIAQEARDEVLLAVRDAQAGRRQALRNYLPDRNIALEAYLREIDHVISTLA